MKHGDSESAPGFCLFHAQVDLFNFSWLRNDRLRHGLTSTKIWIKADIL